METLSIGAFVIGATQIIKSMQVLPAKCTPAVAVLLGAGATYLSLNQVELWAQVSTFLIGLTATGLVSFTKEISKKV